MKIIVFALITISILFGCNKNSNTCKYAAEPPVFFFQIKKDGITLNDSVLNGLTISYFSGTIKKYISDLSVATDSSGILVSRQIGTFENQDFYINYPNSSDIDTLTVLNLMPSPSTDCKYKIEQVKFNDSIVVSDTAIANNPLYVLVKQ